MGGNRHQAQAAYEVSLYARCIDGKKKQLTVALVDQEGLPIAQAKLKVQDLIGLNTRRSLSSQTNIKVNWARIPVLPSCLRERKR